MIKVSSILKCIIASSTFILSTILCSMQNVQTGAGILPYIVEKTNNKTRIYFLLGREAHGKNKNKWTDFGGLGKSSETAHQVAAREGSEETMGILSESYIASKIKNLGPKSNQRIGNTFIINIEDKAGVNPTAHHREKFIRKFNKKRSELLSRKPVPYCKLEKDKFSWWRRKDLIKAIKSNSKDLRKSLKNVYGQPKNIQILENIK